MLDFKKYSVKDYIEHSYKNEDSILLGMDPKNIISRRDNEYQQLLVDNKNYAINKTDYKGLFASKSLSVKVDSEYPLYYCIERFIEVLSLPSIKYMKNIKRDKTSYYNYKTYHFNNKILDIEYEKNKSTWKYCNYSFSRVIHKNKCQEYKVLFNNNFSIHEKYNSKGVCLSSTLNFKHDDATAFIKMKMKRGKCFFSSNYNMFKKGHVYLKQMHLQNLKDASITHLYNELTLFFINLNVNQEQYELYNYGLTELKKSLIAIESTGTDNNKTLLRTMLTNIKNSEDNDS